MPDLEESLFQTMTELFRIGGFKMVHAAVQLALRRIARGNRQALHDSGWIA